MSLCTESYRGHSSLQVLHNIQDEDKVTALPTVTEHRDPLPETTFRVRALGSMRGVLGVDKG